jgi:hypothetical protein
MPFPPEEFAIYEVQCLSCGTKKRLALGQPPPRCPHCWSALVPRVEAPPPSPGGDPAQGLGGLLAKGWEPRAQADRSPEGMATCHLCGMFVKPLRFCSDCGAPLPDPVPAV